jgi:hypothetical protein
MSGSGLCGLAPTRAHSTDASVVNSLLTDLGAEELALEPLAGLVQVR